MNQLLQDFFKGDVRALSRIITRVENRAPDSLDILRQLFPHTGKSQIIGITGSPGAGNMEIGDVFVINKADRPGVEKMERAVQAVLSLAHRPDMWDPPIVRTVATQGEGVDELVQAIDRCHEYFRNSETRAQKRKEAE